MSSFIPSDLRHCFAILHRYSCQLSEELRWILSKWRDLLEERLTTYRPILSIRRINAMEKWPDRRRIAGPGNEISFIQTSIAFSCSTRQTKSGVSNSSQSDVGSHVEEKNLYDHSISFLTKNNNKDKSFSSSADQIHQRIQFIYKSLRKCLYAWCVLYSTSERAFLVRTNPR